MIKVNTAEENILTYNKRQSDWIYNAMDCCLTCEVFEHLNNQVNKDDNASCSYHFVSAMQGPAMAMAMRGIRINVCKRVELINDLKIRIDKLQYQLDVLAEAVWDKGLNPRSPKQLKTFLYDVMGFPEQMEYNSQKKQRTVSTSSAALEKVAINYLARQFVAHILRIRDLSKKIGTLRTGIDKDNRMRTSYNVCGTETGRWSSNSNAFRTGTNLQNITNELREIFIADEGMKMAYIDLEQAESRAVAYLAGDTNYINACENGDLHTDVARMLWPDATLDQILKEPFSGIHTRRDLSKRCGHGTNYYGKPPTIAKHTGGIDVKVVEEFQYNYFTAFPGIPQWHQDIATQLQKDGAITTPMGRKRIFFGRHNTDDTLREAIAFGPQSLVGELLNLGMYRVWEKLDLGTGEIQLLAQVHDAILIQYPDKGYDYELDLFDRITSLIQVPIKVRGREMIIPASVEGVGWNWRKYDVDKNPDGLKGLSEDDRNRKRTERVSSSTNLLATKLYRVQ